MHAIVTDGTGQLYVINTGIRSEKQDWKVTQIHNVGKPFSILHSNFEATSKTLSALLLSVTPDEDSGSLHVKHTVLLTVAIFSREAGENGEMKFSFEAQKEFQSHSVPLYGAIEPDNQAILVASEKPFSLVHEKSGGEQYVKIILSEQEITYDAFWPVAHAILSSLKISLLILLSLTLAFRN